MVIWSYECHELARIILNCYIDLLTFVASSYQLLSVHMYAYVNTVDGDVYRGPKLRLFFYLRGQRRTWWDLRICLVPVSSRRLAALELPLQRAVYSSPRDYRGHLLVADDFSPSGYAECVPLCADIQGKDH
jgi:hypothetical protein